MIFSVILSIILWWVSASANVVSSTPLFRLYVEHSQASAIQSSFSFHLPGFCIYISCTWLGRWLCAWTRCSHLLRHSGGSMRVFMSTWKSCPGHHKMGGGAVSFSFLWDEYTYSATLWELVSVSFSRCFLQGEYTYSATTWELVSFTQCFQWGEYIHSAIISNAWTTHCPYSSVFSSLSSGVFIEQLSSTHSLVNTEHLNNLLARIIWSTQCNWTAY